MYNEIKCIEKLSIFRMVQHKTKCFGVFAQKNNNEINEAVNSGLEKSVTAIDEMNLEYFAPLYHQSFQTIMNSFYLRNEFFTCLTIAMCAVVLITNIKK